VRRRIVAGIGVVVVILIVLIVNACKKSAEQQSLKDYNRSVSALGREYEEQVAHPLFSSLAGASSKSALDVEVQIDQLRMQAQKITEQAQRIELPGSMTAAQRALLLSFHLRVEGLTKISALAPTLLGSQGSSVSARLAGDMELFLASDVIYSQRVVPLIGQTLSERGIHGQSTAPSRFLPNTGWLDANTAFGRVSGQATGGASAQSVTGNHGSALVSTTVGTTTLEGEPTINHIAGGGNPTFTVAVENSGEFKESNVKVDVTVTAGGKQLKASHVINQTQPGAKVNVEIPVSGVPLGVAGKVEVSIEGVPGENDLENNKSTYLAIFSQ
jgi:hypothetical protein